MVAPERRRVEDLVERALEIEPPERRRWIETSCAGDAALTREVLALLEAIDDSAGFLEPSRAPRPEDLAPTRIGPFRLLEELATGGMSSVHLAEQDSPRRRVALKISSFGLSGSSARHRFEFEAEILGGLRHPAIAQVYASGTWRTGRRELPWLALEYVEGARSLTRYAREETLDRSARIELVRAICDAVQYSHGRGVIHRDLKPANLLVDRGGRPKVIDFGIAKAARDSGDAPTFATREGEILGTVRYMSPEQLAGRPDEVDGRSDVYALGVVLYELLCDALPHDFDGKSLTEITRLVGQQRPRRPTALVPDLEGDLEWVLLRALEPERDRRYASAAELSAELRRFLVHEPVLAGPPSRVHAAVLFARRHRGAVAVAVVLVLSLLVFTAFLVRSNRELGRANDRALANQERAEDNAYAAGVGAVELALRTGEAELARRIHTGLDPGRRGWEWHHLRARLERVGREALVAEGRLWAVDFHPAGDAWASAGEHQPIRIHFLDGERAPIEIEDVEGGSLGLRFDPSGRYLVTGHATGRARVWDARSGAPVATLEAGRGPIHDFAFHPLDGRMATSGWLGKTLLWSCETWERVGELGDRTSKIMSLAFSPNGRRLATASKDFRVRVYDVDSGHEELELEASTPSSWVGHWPVRFCDDGNRLVAGAPDGSLRSWNAHTGALERMVTYPHGRLVDAVLLPGGAHLAAVTSMGATVLVELESLRIVSTRWAHTLTPLSIAVSPDGSRLVSAGRDDRAYLWSTEELLGDFDTLAPHRVAASAVAISRDESHVATSGGRYLHVTDAATGRSLGWTARGEDHVLGLAFGERGCHLYSLDIEGSLREWRVADGERLRTVQTPHGRGAELVGAPGGTRLATVGKEGRLLVWDTESLETVAQLDLEGRQPKRCTFEPGGERLVYVGGAGQLRVLSFPGLLPLPSPPRIGANVRAFAPHPDGRRIAVQGSDGVLRVLAVDRGEPLLEVPGPVGFVSSLDYSSDGSRLAALTLGGSLHLFDAESGRQLFSTTAHEQDGKNVRFSPRDTYLVTTGDLAARIWHTRGPSER